MSSLLFYTARTVSAVGSAIVLQLYSRRGRTIDFAPAEIDAGEI